VLRLMNNSSRIRVLQKGKRSPAAPFATVFASLMRSLRARRKSVIHFHLEAAMNPLAQQGSAVRCTTAAEVKEIVRSVLVQCSVPFTAIDITATPSAWKVIVHDPTGMIFRMPVHAGPARYVREAVLEAIEAEW
jgi:hypothetical protein